MASIFHPGQYKPLVEELVRSQIRQEQVQREESEQDLSRLNTHFKHDPFWRTRFWSIQHVHDVAYGKTWHWFWTPMKEIYLIAQIMFIALPVAAYGNAALGLTINLVSLLTSVAALRCIIYGYKHFIEWTYWWRFKRLVGRRA